MRRQTLEGQGHEKNKTAEINLCRNIIKVCRNKMQDQAQRIGRDIKTRSYDRGSDKG